MTAVLPSQHHYVRSMIESRCEAALQEADVAGVFPLPVDCVLAAVGIEDIIDIGQLPAPAQAAKPRHLKRLLGALIPREKTVFIDFDQPTGRVLWTKGHEATHKLLPWHEAAVTLDDERRLHRDSAEQLETEANLGAAYLIFQNGRTMSRALDYHHGLDTPVVLAPDLGASMSATIRFYVENHTEPMALLQTGRLRGRSGKVPVFLHVTSPSWLTEFPDPAVQFGPKLDLRTGRLGQLARQVDPYGGVCAVDGKLRNRRRSPPTPPNSSAAPSSSPRRAWSTARRCCWAAWGAR